METNTDNIRLKVAKQYFVDYTKNGTGILKALNLILPEIEKLKEQGIKNREQIAIFESMFDVKINYETYRQFVYSKLKKRPKKKKKTITSVPTPEEEKTTPPVVPPPEKEEEKTAPKEPNKTVEKVAPKESINKKTVLDIMNDFDNKKASLSRKKGLI